MDPVRNPYSPGAGTAPPELAGRDDLRDKVRIAIERLRRGLAAKSVLMVGLRGVGKTVLLDRMRDDAEAAGVHTLRIEAPEGRSLPALLAPQLRQALLRLSRNQQARALAQRALRGLAGFAKSLKLKYADIEVGLDLEPEAGLADNGDLEHDLQALFEATGAAAQKADTALALFIDELQYVKEDELAALITAMHRCNQPNSTTFTTLSLDDVLAVRNRSNEGATVGLHPIARGRSSAHRTRVSKEQSQQKTWPTSIPARTAQVLFWGHDNFCSVLNNQRGVKLNCFIEAADVQAECLR